MLEPPPEVSEPAIVALLAERWGMPLEWLEHYPYGFGAWHWKVADGAGHTWFLTADRLTQPGRASELESTYSAARALCARGLEFVVACLPSRSGRMVEVLNGFAFSVTAWQHGARAVDSLTPAVARETVGMLRRLHGQAAPAGTLVWDHRLSRRRELERIEELTALEWSRGPLGPDARTAVRERQSQIPVWLARYDARVAKAVQARETWVVTHGEPGVHNQLLTAAGRRWVDWESMRVAPAERDLTDLVRVGGASPSEYPAADPALLELFDLRWRLDEIAGYVDWLRGPHGTRASDQAALADLIEELNRDDWFP